MNLSSFLRSLLAAYAAGACGHCPNDDAAR